jgi:predicted SprT family Zn-dependent metalloprotease
MELGDELSFIYSETSLSFLKRIRILSQTIFQDELNIKLGSKRFLFNGTYFPFHLVVFEHPTALGYFDSRFYQIGLSKALMYDAKEIVLKNILRHEIAHYLTYVRYGEQDSSHSSQFREVCRTYHWGAEVYLAKVDLKIANDSIEGDLKHEKVISKVKKLLKLAASENENEAKLATIKANQLLLKHNLEQFEDHKNSDEEDTYVKRVLFGKRRNAKHGAIYDILTTFFVQPVFNGGNSAFYLEVIGGRASIELADYVAKFLDAHLEFLWKGLQKMDSTLKGITAKNSFMRGVSAGYLSKITHAQNDIITSKDLVLLNNSVQRHVQRVYFRLGTTKTTGMNHAQAASLGISIGKNLSINPGLSSHSGKTKLLK